MGDDIQAMKAGLLEIADVFIVNKADLPGADDVVAQLESMLGLGRAAASDWRPPVLKTVAVKSEGIPQLAEALWRHRRYLLDSGKFAENIFKWEFQFFRQLVMEMAAEKIFEGVKDAPAYHALVEDLKNRRIDPISAAEKMLQMFRLV